MWMMLALLPGAAAQAKELVDYVTQAPAYAPPGKAGQALLDNLNEAVGEMVADGKHWAPAFNKNGIGVTLYHFGCPAQAVNALSIALPYLKPELREKTIAYLQDFMKTYPPLTTAWIEQADAQREYFPLPERLRNPYKSFDTKPAVPIEALYAVWNYCNATGDWGYVRQHLDEMDALARSGGGRLQRYGQITGLIGYCRILDELRMPEKAKPAAEQAVAAMTAGLNFKAFTDTAEKAYLQPGSSGIGTGGDWHIALWYFLRTKNGYNERAMAPVGVFFAPEVGEYLADDVPEAKKYVEDLFQTYRSWAVVRGDMGGTHHKTGERSFFFFDQNYSAFMAQAYILKADPAVLAAAVDYPFCLGDLYYIEKLVAALRAR